MANENTPTPRQHDLLLCIAAFTTEHGYAPTIRQMCERMGVNSTNAIQDHLRGLRVKGLVERDHGQARTLCLTSEARYYIASQPETFTKEQASALRGEVYALNRVRDALEEIFIRPTNLVETTVKDVNAALNRIEEDIKERIQSIETRLKKGTIA